MLKLAESEDKRSLFYFGNSRALVQSEGFLSHASKVPSIWSVLVLIGLVGFLRADCTCCTSTAESCKDGNMDEEQHYMRFSNDEYEGGEYIGEVDLQVAWKLFKR